MIERVSAWERACRGKRRYREQQWAEAMRAAIQAGPRWDHLPLNTFLCSYCDQWHIGHVAAPEAIASQQAAAAIRERQAAAR